MPVNEPSNDNSHSNLVDITPVPNYLLTMNGDEFRSLLPNFSNEDNYLQLCTNLFWQLLIKQKFAICPCLVQLPLDSGWRRISEFASEFQQ